MPLGVRCRTVALLACVLPLTWAGSLGAADEPPTPPAPPAPGPTPQEEVVRLSALVREAHRLLAQRRYDEAIARYREVVEFLKREKGDSHGTVIALQRLGWALADASKHQEALAVHRDALEMARRTYAGDHAQLAGTLTDAARALDALGRHAEALPLRVEARDMVRRLFPGDHADVAGALANLAVTYAELGRHADALPLELEALAMQRRLHPGDDADLATTLGNVASTYLHLGRPAEALALQVEALAMTRRLFSGDDALVATRLSGLATTYADLGRDREALPLYLEALAMRRRLFPGDHRDLVASLQSVASTQEELGDHDEALALKTEALAMARRLFPGDHPEVALQLRSLATTLAGLGREAEALPLKAASLAMFRRLFRGDHPEVAAALGSLARSLGAVGREDEALGLHRDALAMMKRLVPGDHPRVSTLLNNLAASYDRLGRPTEALPLRLEVLAMRRRLHAGDSADVARALNGLGATRAQLGQHEEALPLFREALAMQQRLFPGDHQETAVTLGNVASALAALGRHEDALGLKVASLDMRRRLFPGDHPDVALGMNNLSTTLSGLGRHAEALALDQEALAMRRRLYGDEHPDVLASLTNLAVAYDHAGRREDAIAQLRLAAAGAQRAAWPYVHLPLTFLGRLLLSQGRPEEAIAPLQDAAQDLDLRRGEARSLAAPDRTLYELRLRKSDPYAPLARALAATGRVDDALATLERGRGRALLDLVAGGQVDAIGLVEQRARTAGEEALRARIANVRETVHDAQARLVAAEHELERARRGGDLDARRTASAALAAARRALGDALSSEAELVKDAVPETSLRTPAELQALLAPGERLLVYALDENGCQAFLVPPRGRPIQVFDLRGADGTLEPADVATAVEERREVLTRSASEERPSTDLFRLLVPEALWGEIRAVQALYVVPHGALHGLPFEALAVGEREGQTLYWLDEGPPVAYVPSGSLLAWLRGRRAEQDAAPGPARLVALGDPAFRGADGAPAWPDQGVLVTETPPGGQAQTLGIRPGDVLVGYAGATLLDPGSLRAAIQARLAHGSAGRVEVRLVREGQPLAVEAAPGKLGVNVAAEPPPLAGPAFVERSALGLPTGLGLERGGARRLRPLPGTRIEVESIREALAATPGAPVEWVALVGGDATEERLARAAQGARYLHLATHGLVDESESASFSALALTAPLVPVPGNDGFLTLLDLLGSWRARLRDTRLVVLSACETQRGALRKDEGVVALPWGFQFAGCPTVVATHWKVDDASAPLLMASFYRRLLARDGAGRLEALLAAKRALKATHPHPYHWAPYVLLGDPR